MLRRFIRNKKGTAEIIGSVMFIVILLFFFTNVYLWHDAAVKEMNDLYVQKINSPIVASVSYSATYNRFEINVTNSGGVAATISRIWANIKAPAPNLPDLDHLNFTRSGNVAPGYSIIEYVTLPYALPVGSPIEFKVITTIGNFATCSYYP